VRAGGRSQSSLQRFGSTVYFYNPQWTEVGLAGIPSKISYCLHTKMRLKGLYQSDYDLWTLLGHTGKVLVALTTDAAGRWSKSEALRATRRPVKLACGSSKSVNAGDCHLPQ